MTAVENQIVVYQPNETVRLDVRLENETVWLTQLKIAELFGVQKAAISKHVKNIFASGELVRDATVSKLETVQTEGGRTVVRTQEFFNLDVIIAVGYRVNSRRATQFRIWATKVLKEYLLRGYSVNARLNQLEDAMHRNLAKHDDRIAGTHRIAHGRGDLEDLARHGCRDLDAALCAGRCRCGSRSGSCRRGGCRRRDRCCCNRCRRLCRALFNRDAVSRSVHCDRIVFHLILLLWDQCHLLL